MQLQKPAKICSTTLCMHISRAFLSEVEYISKLKAKNLQSEWQNNFLNFFQCEFSANHAFIRLEAQLKGRLHTILQSVANKTEIV